MKWMIEATDPLGATEHLEFKAYAPRLPTFNLPANVFADNDGRMLDNTYYWSKKAGKKHPTTLPRPKSPIGRSLTMPSGRFPCGPRCAFSNYLQFRHWRRVFQMSPGRAIMR